MAKAGTCYFDSKGGVHKTAENATKEDIAELLGKVGEGDSLAPGIATRILEKRAEIENVFREHDQMVGGCKSEERVG